MLDDGNMCCVTTENDIKAFKKAYSLHKRKFNINSIIFQSKNKHKVITHERS